MSVDAGIEIRGKQQFEHGDQRTLQQQRPGKCVTGEQCAHALEYIGRRQGAGHPLHPLRQYGERIEHRRER